MHAYTLKHRMKYTAACVCTWSAFIVKRFNCVECSIHVNKPNFAVHSYLQIVGPGVNQIWKTKGIAGSSKPIETVHGYRY